MTISALARPEIRRLSSYKAVVAKSGIVNLSSNEAPLAIGTGQPEGLNRYPAPRPAELTRKLAAYYGVDERQVLVTRGSSEGIDLLIRTFCCAGRDEVLLTPPAFEMYRVYASIQGAHVVNIPLLATHDFSVDTEALVCATNERTKLVFLCSPNNPVGTVIPPQQILRVLDAISGQAIVVLDEAYIEYSDTNSLAPLVSKYENLVVLRTLSKGLALAGARCGVVVASPELVSLLDRVLPPYAMSSPAIASAERALSKKQLVMAHESIREIVVERERLRVELSTSTAVEKVWPSQANFLFVRFRDLDEICRRLEDAGISIRTYSESPVCERCARISIGSSADNDRLLDVIRRVS